MDVCSVMFIANCTWLGIYTEASAQCGLASEGMSVPPEQINRPATSSRAPNVAHLYRRRLFGKYGHSQPESNINRLFNPENNGIEYARRTLR